MCTDAVVNRTSRESQVRKMRKFFSIAAAGILALALAACGGGEKLNSAGTTGTGGGGTTTGGTPASISVTTSASSIPADGSATATITATVLDATSAPVSGVAVTFTTSAGTITVVTGTTGTAGTATATLAAGSATAGTTITVTATSGTLSGVVKVGVGQTAQQTVSLETDLPQIPSDGSKPATITALVRDSNNNFVPNVQVQFSATSGGITLGSTGSTGTPGMTNSSGAATATLTTAGDPTNRSITVTATVGPSKQTLVVNVVGTTLSLSGPSSLVQGSVGSFTVALTDSSKNAISGAKVTVASKAGNALSGTTLTTDSSGNASFTMTGTNSGADTISATALSLTASQAVAVSNQLFTFSAPAANADVALGQVATVTVNWKSNGTPVTGQTVTFASTRGTLSAATAVTDGSGNASVTISSASSGPAIVSATATGVTATQNINFVATTPASISVQPSPSTIAINGQSTITAIVRDASNNLVQGKTVTFQLTDVTGGSLSFASAVTDSEGVAQTVYTAGNTPSTSNGVSITGTVQGTSVTHTATLTVGGQTVFISLGTGNTLNENTNKTQFQMPWVVQAVDSAGNPVNGVQIALTIHSASRPTIAYWKGSYVFCGTSWQQYNTTKTCGSAGAPVGCLNEDLNLTGVFETAEDTNNNGKLDPGDVAVATPGTLTTASDGSATFLVEYPEDHALWVQATLTATATVQGTQTTTSATFVLPMLAAYLTNSQVTPPGFISPYGTAGVCTNPN